VKIVWHPLAQADLIELITYIANDNPPAAARVHDEIRRQIGMLSGYPEMGRIGRVPRTRELIVAGTPFVTVYGVDDAVTILRVLHGARRWPPPE
jgi:toxin ParE1/3/4